MAEGLSAREAARLLRQRMEMGGGELFLDGLTRSEAMRLASSAGNRSRTGSDRIVQADARPSRTAAPTASAGPPAPRTVADTSPPDAPVRGGGSSAESASPPAGAGPPPPLVLPDDHGAVREIALECTRCALCRTRTQVVFSDGPPNARLMVVGEAPGANEDETGVPFVGAAGRYLDLLLATVGLSREDSVYIANVLKCRPPGNRNPLPEEIDACAPYLRKQIELVAPRALLAVGSFSGKLLTGDQKSSLGKLRGRVHAYQGVPLVVTYHPAALLRNPNWTRSFWEDLQLLRDVIDADAPSR